MAFVRLSLIRLSLSLSQNSSHIQLSSPQKKWNFQHLETQSQTAFVVWTLDVVLLPAAAAACLLPTRNYGGAERRVEKLVPKMLSGFNNTYGEQAS